jgi:prephenate dehydrogenase
MKIFVVGLGLMGASYAEKLTQKGHQVYGYDINPNYIKAAQEDGVILDNSNLSRLSTADVVILSLYPEHNVTFVKDHVHLFKKGAFITDISGVKQSVVHDIESVLREDLHYVSHHPMAGRAKEGYQHRDPDMFMNNHFLIIESERASLTDYELIEIIGKQLGFKTLTRISASLHDQMIAYTSQLTHMIAVSLMLGYPSESHRFTGDSFRDLTRIANINEKLWTELFLSNQQDLLDAVDIFKKHLIDLENAIKNNDQETLMKLLRSSREKRKDFENDPK